ncbi:MAG: 4-hydroxy-tetrahydrodipicolinate reductase [Gracilibacteraceae bacterium]|jgi:4-hydroxy-tetrahydrodipicolinate reductase|nr:4-hydroxy-tetrahydrodipicolinate reductase [Gracilibacteraceae bacterium]
MAGACGQMGRVVIETLLRQADMELAGAADVLGEGRELPLPAGRPPLRLASRPERETLRTLGAEVMVDFTGPEAASRNAAEALHAGAVPVIGSTGLDEDAMTELRRLSREKGIGVFIAPNFALGAILMMKFAEQAAAYFPDVEIIEMHHDRKLDAPSGTALRTAEWIARARSPKRQGRAGESEKLPGARGGDFEGMRIHAVRLPGLEAHQTVIFAGAGQSLTIRHDAYSRETYMPGVMLAVRKSRGLKDFVVGLENFLD